MAGIILDGKAEAEKILVNVRESVESFLKSSGRRPKLSVIMVGNDDASSIYVRNKARACEKTGMLSEIIRMPETTTKESLARQIAQLNAQNDTDGILVQLPLPAHIPSQEIIDLIRPDKDADGFTSTNTGKLWQGPCRIGPCTPFGIMRLMDSYQLPMEGQHAVIVGRSNIVGKPMAALLLQRHCTVTITHSRTRALSVITQQADVLIAAIGKPAFITREHIRPGAMIIDVGINRVPTEKANPKWPESQKNETGKTKKDYILVGDADPCDTIELSSYYTPVPGGVGALTVAQLLDNTVILAQRRTDQHNE